MTLTDEQIEEIKARAEAATPGPWDMLRGSLVRAIKGDFAVPIFESQAPIDWHKNKRLTSKVIRAAYADEWNNANFIAHARTDIPALLSALEAEKKRADEAEDRAERFQDVLQELQQWVNAYPLDIYPEPNFRLAAKVLTDAGLSLDAISASNMRHVLTRVEEITRGVLNEKETGNDAE